MLSIRSILIELIQNPFMHGMHAHAHKHTCHEYEYFTIVHVT